MKNKENYLLTIYKEHRNRPFNIYRLSGCGGCIEIEKRLYICMEEDLGIICNLNTYKKTQRRKYLSSHPKGNKMLLNMCERINALDKFNVDSMSRVYFMHKDYFAKKFYKINANTDNFLKFIIMHVWDNLSLLTSYRNREEKLEFLKTVITNKPVLEAIESMDNRYRKNFLNNPALVRSYN